MGPEAVAYASCPDVGQNRLQIRRHDGDDKRAFHGRPRRTSELGDRRCKDEEDPLRNRPRVREDARMHVEELYHLEVGDSVSPSESPTSDDQ